MNRFASSKQFFYMGIVALVLGLMSALVGYRWLPAAVPAVLFLATSAFLFLLHFQPTIEVTDRELSIGSKSIPWSSIQSIETTNWITPLVLRFTLEGGRRILLVYPGDPENASRLKEIVSVCAPHALLNGRPQRKRQATIAVRDSKNAKLEKYPLLTSEDEAEVERMFQRLREVGNLDSQNSPEDK